MGTLPPACTLVPVPYPRDPEDRPATPDAAVLLATGQPLTGEDEAGEREPDNRNR